MMEGADMEERVMRYDVQYVRRDGANGHLLRDGETWEDARRRMAAEGSGGGQRSDAGAGGDAGDGGDVDPLALPVEARFDGDDLALTVAASRIRNANAWRGGRTRVARRRLDTGVYVVPESAREALAYTERALDLQAKLAQVLGLRNAGQLARGGIQRFNPDPGGPLRNAEQPRIAPNDVTHALQVLGYHGGSDADQRARTAQIENMAEGWADFTEESNALHDSVSKARDAMLAKNRDAWKTGRAGRR
jgi:hypothetical protein